VLSASTVRRRVDWKAEVRARDPNTYLASHSAKPGRRVWPSSVRQVLDRRRELFTTRVSTARAQPPERHVVPVDPRHMDPPPPPSCRKRWRRCPATSRSRGSPSYPSRDVSARVLWGFSEASPNSRRYAAHGGPPLEVASGTSRRLPRCLRNGMVRIRAHSTLRKDRLSAASALQTKL
jgi:hypothetical protein